MKPLKYFTLFIASGMLTNGLFRVIPEAYLSLFVVFLVVSLTGLIYCLLATKNNFSEALIIISIIAIGIGIILGF